MAEVRYITEKDITFRISEETENELLNLINKSIKSDANWDFTWNEDGHSNEFERIEDYISSGGSFERLFKSLVRNSSIALSDMIWSSKNIPCDFL